MKHAGPSHESNERTAFGIRARAPALVVVLAVLGVMPAPIEAGDGAEKPGHAYTIAIDGAATILPEPLRGFFTARRGDLAQAAAAHDRSVEQDSSVTLDPHTVALDADMNAAPASFPRDRDQAIALQRNFGVQPVGVLPWTVLDRFHALTKSFGDGDSQRIVRDAGTLLCAATDASLPFNTTRRPHTADWPSTRADDAGDHALGLQQSLRNRWQVELLTRMHGRAAYEVRIDRQRVRPIDSTEDVVFAELLASHRLIGILIEIDTEIMAELGINSGGGFVSRADAYYERLAARAGWILTARLESASVLGARLILTAWSLAGMPPLPLETSQRIARDGDSEGTPPEKRTPSAAAYVGSRNSNIVHKSDCPHAQRIKLENRVEFDALQRARSAGRKPCRTCNPHR